MSVARRAIVRVLGTRPVSGAVVRSLPAKLRILAYHGVTDPVSFEKQLDHILARFVPLSGREVVAHLEDKTEFPPRGVWITFDDGSESVVEHALPALVRRGVRATMFVCPGLVENDQHLWWDTVSAAAEAGWVHGANSPSALVSRLKSVPDSHRRRVVRDAEEFLLAEPSHGRPSPVADKSRLSTWMAAGMEIGNHTWDHPCLDRSDPELQRRQIQSADAWLAEFGAFDDVRLFAYPNGDWTSDSEQILQDLGYQAALLFDHRLNDLPLGDPLRLSRLRIDASAGLGRARAIVAGAHSLLYRPAPVAPNVPPAAAV